MREQIQAKGISASTLKIIAIIGMTLNHIAVIYEANLSFVAICILQTFGGMTFPIMAYLLGEGYRYTSNIKKYALRLLFFACIAEVPFRLFLDSSIGNVLFTLFLGLLAIYLYERVTKEIFLIAFIGLIIASSFFDWGGIGVLMIFFYYILQDERKRVVIPTLLFSFASVVDIMIIGTLGALEEMGFLIGCTLSIPLLLYYNGSKGKSMKYFFYIYYPLHILVLGLLQYL